MGDEFRLEDIFIILQRRFLYFIVPLLILAPIGLVIVAVLPAKYTAQGTILVESQQIPEELIQSTVNSFAEERIQIIRQRVMTRNRLLEVADKYQLFPRNLGLSESERVEKMRERLKVSLISVDTRNRRRDDATIAFQVSYSDRSADKAFQVANEFMTLFLTEDVKARAAGASNTTEFFNQETQRLRASVEVLEERIATYKSENADALPEHLNMHIQQLSRSTEELANNQNSILLFEEEMRSLETQLASYLAGNSSTDGPAQDLARMRAELTAMLVDKTREHPDVKALQEQIAGLERQLAPNATVRSIRRQLDQAQEDLRAARNAENPDAARIESLTAKSSDLRDRLRSELTSSTGGSGDFIATQIQGRIDVARNRLEALEAKNASLREQIADLQNRIARTPAIERGLSALTRDYENIFGEYQQVQAKQQSAILAENLEDNQKSEKFSILEPAARPETPSSPDRPKLSVLAVILSLGAGGACALFAELLMGAVRGRDHVTEIMGEAPIGVVPYIRLEGEKKIKLPARKNRRSNNDSPFGDAAATA